MKTWLFKYTENFTTKKSKFSDKKFWYFSYFCSKHRLLVLVRTAAPRWFNEYLQFMFLSRNKKKIMYTPIKVGFTGGQNFIRMFSWWIAKHAKFLHANNEDSGQTVRTRRLIWVFVSHMSESTLAHVATNIYYLYRRLEVRTRETIRTRRCYITKTCLFKHTENFTTRNWNFSNKKFWYFSHFCSKHRLWYSLEPPRRGGSNEYPQPMFLSRNKKNNVYPRKPQFYQIKVGFKGVKIIKVCFPDVLFEENTFIHTIWSLQSIHLKANARQIMNILANKGLVSWAFR